MIMDNREIYGKVLGMIDLTSLNGTDTYTGIRAMVSKVNGFKELFPGYELPASICVYPNFARTVASELKCKDVHVTVVGGCFPASQSFREVKELECRMAVEQGADEVDIVLAHNNFLEGRQSDAQDEIVAVGRAVRGIRPDVVLKVILETGALKSRAAIEEASWLAMEAGADFIKTSTGKTQPAATPEAAEAMCGCIRDYYRKTGRMVGFKPAGGISTPEDALTYYGIVADVLGEEWLDKRRFRFGASRMANNLISALEGREVKYY